MRLALNASRISNPDQLPFDHPRRIPWEHAQYRDLPFHSLIALYILADALLVQDLKDPIITALVEVYGFNSPGKEGYKLYWRADQPDPLKRPTRSINSAWEALPKGSNLCQLLVQLFCDSMMDIERHCVEEQLHPGFLAAVGAEFAQRWWDDEPTSQWTTTRAICSFHEHEGTKCALSEMYLEDRKRMASG